MIELLVVIGIIVLLAAILVPVISQVRMQGYKATTTGEMQRIMTACLNYYHDFNSYPGPLANSQVVPQAPNAVPVNMQSTAGPSVTPTTITSSENLVLGLLGLLSPGNSQGDVNSHYAPPPPQHDVVSLNYLHPASYHYIDYIPEELTDGLMFGAAIRASGQLPPTNWGTTPQGLPGPESDSVSDSPIPEFQDHIPDAMPILYLKAYTGVQIGQPPGPSDGIVTGDESKAPAQYNFAQLAPYGFMRVKTNPPPSDFPFPANLNPPSAATVPNEVVAYFLNPNIAGQPRGKDSFILISAGPDRLYGTADDIIVAP